MNYDDFIRLLFDNPSELIGQKIIDELQNDDMALEDTDGYCVLEWDENGIIYFAQAPEWSI